MKLVNRLVEFRAVQGTVGPVVYRVFDDKEDGNLVSHGEDRREGNGGCEAKVLGKRVEKPDLRQLDSKMRQKDIFGAFPLLGSGRNFLPPRWSVSRTKFIEGVITDNSLVGSYTC